MRREMLVAAWLLAAGCGGSSDVPARPPVTGHVIEIDIDDHGLAALWMANAPNLKGLIARGTLAYSRVVVPTHSNQNNMALLTGQYPEGDNVPSNSWLSRALDFKAPVNLPGIEVGDYAAYDTNPLLVRGDSVYGATRRAGARSAYFGQLPPFEAGADEVHLTIVGASFGTTMITSGLAAGLLTDILHYPKKVVDGYHLDGPAAAGETYLRFTMRDAATFIRSTSAAQPMPAFTFIWDFIAIDGDPTATFGADGADVVKIIEDYDLALGDLLAALQDKSLLDDTNILFTLDHGKVDTRQQVVLGTRGQGVDGTTGATIDADGQLGELVASQGLAFGITPADYAILNEDGDALIYARLPGAGTPAGAARQDEVTHALLLLIQSGEITGLDVTRTMTADGAMGTRTFHDFRGSGPNQADIVVFPIDDWTLNQVDATNARPGPFLEHNQFPFGRHGGFSADELYVPLIMAGPAFKSGALLPHPIEHPDVPATALATLGAPRLTTAARGPIRAALAGDATEVWPQPADLSGARASVLDAAGYGTRQALAGAPATAAVLIDVGGLYEDELFDDDALADAARPLRDLAATGTRFSDVWTRSRDWPVTEYQMLSGGYPTAPFIAAAEDDPTQSIAPAAGLLQMPIAPGFVANRAAYDAWRQAAPFAGESLFDAAHALGLTTALIGQPDFHALHVAGGGIDVTMPADLAGTAGALRDLMAQHPRLLAVVALGGARPGDRHADAARTQLAALAAAVVDIAGAAGGALVAITSRGATTIDDASADRYGAGSSRHVPLLLLGPNVRAGAISGQPGAPADLPATILFGLGATSASDVATGTWAQGTAIGGVPQPTPRTATEGHALMRAFTTVAAP
jgi:hypothetical protein